MLSHNIKHFSVSITVFLFLLMQLSPLSVVAAQTDDWEWTTPTQGEPNNFEIQSEQQETFPPTVIINEILPNPEQDGDDTEEYTELYNYGIHPQDINGWKLQDKSGKLYTIADQELLQPKSYLVIHHTLALNNTSDETLALIDADGVVQDMIEYQEQDVEKGVSLSRFCDVYEMRFCSLEKADLTPGVANNKTALRVWSTEQSGMVERGTSVELLTNIPNSTIVYTYDPNNPDPDAQHIYEEPFVIYRATTIYYFATYEGKMSAMQSLSFSVPEVRRLVMDYGVKINELYPNPKGEDLGREWIELKNFEKEKVDLSGWMLAFSEDLDSCYDESKCLRLPQGTVIYPKQFLTITLRGSAHYVLPNKEGVVYLLDAGGNITDDVYYQEGDTGTREKSFARKYYLDATLNEYRKPKASLQNSVYDWTDFPTKGGENMVLLIPDFDEDKDRDMLTALEEETVGTDPKQFDTDRNMIPDVFDTAVFEKEDKDVRDYRYREALSQLINVHYSATEDELALSGKALPGSTVQFFYDDESMIGSTYTDEFGRFTWDVDASIQDDERAILMRLLDQQQVASLYSHPIIIKEAFTHKGESNQLAEDELQAGDLVLSSAFPNPEGADEREEEWVEVSNVSDGTIDLSVASLQINGKKKKQLPKVLLAQGESYVVSGEELGMTIPNSNATLTLAGQDEKVFDQVTYAKTTTEQTHRFHDVGMDRAYLAELVVQPVVEEEIVDEEIREVSPLQRAIVTLPPLETVAIETAKEVPESYDVRKFSKREGEVVVASAIYEEANPAQEQNNILLSLMGSMMAMMSGLIFWKM